MAQPNLTTTQIGNIITTVFNPKVVKMYPDSAKTVTMLFKEGSAQEVTSAGVVITDEIEPNVSGAGLDEGGVLANPSSPRWARRTILYERESFAGDFTRDAYREWIKSANSLARGFGRHLDSHLKQIKRFQNMWFWGAGGGGKGEIAVGDATAGLAANEVKFKLPYGAFNVKKRMEVAFCDPTTLAYRVNGGASVYYMNVVTVDHANRKAVFDVNRPSDYADGDLMVFPRMAGRVPVPMPQHVNNSNTAYFGANPAANYEYKSNYVDGGAAAVTIAKLDELIDARVFTQAGEEGRRCILGSPEQVTAIKRISDTMRQWNDITNLIDFHIKNVNIAGYPIKADEQADPTALWDVCPEDFELYQATPLGVVDLGTGMFNPKSQFTLSGTNTIVGGYVDQMVYYIEWKGQYFCRRRNNQTKLGNLAIPATVRTKSQAWN